MSQPTEKLSAQLRERLAALPPDASVAVSLRLEPIRQEGRPSDLDQSVARAWLIQQTRQAQAHVVAFLEQQQAQGLTIRYWTHYLANRIGVEAPRQVVEALTQFEEIKAISLLTEGDEAFRSG
jgi:hypothetical protein